MTYLIYIREHNMTESGQQSCRSRISFNLLRFLSEMILQKIGNHA